MRRGILTIATIVLCACSFAQHPLKGEGKWIDSIRLLIADSATASLHFTLRADSVLESKWKGFVQANAAHLPHLPVQKGDLAVQKPTGPFLKFNGGILSYDWNYRGHIDTPVREQAIAQNLVSAQMDFTIASAYPVTITYYDRESNSRYFRDYHDLRVEFNSAEFSRLRNDRLKDYTAQAANQLRNPSLKERWDHGR